MVGDSATWAATTETRVTALRSEPAGPLRGRISVPGDKSISHRALMIGAVAVGETRIRGLLEADDVLRTAAALRTLGIGVRKKEDVWFVNGAGVGGLAAPDDVIDFGNSGTSARLVAGLLATQAVDAHLTGDASLRRRPMDRIIVPLSRMGAAFEARAGGRMPLRLRGAENPLPIEYELPVASAQVKSSILLAALNTPGRTTVVERRATRNHTENMLRAFGAAIRAAPAAGGGSEISVEGYAELAAIEVDVPGDPSSAAFPAVAALLAPGSELAVDNVGVNPSRTGFLDTLREMGADFELSGRCKAGGEPVADMVFRHGPLGGVDVPAERAPAMIDEYPIVAVAAAFAQGRTRLRGLAELRVKESDRFAAIVDGLTACGVAARAEGDDIVIDGCGGPPPGGGRIAAKLDHRIAMSFLVMGTAAAAPVRIDDGSAIDTSFPGFAALMAGIGARLRDD